MNYKLLYLFLFVGTNTLFAQIGGDQVYEFLGLPHTARIGSLGGSLIMVKDDDAALGFHNPSLLNQGMHQQVNFNTNFFPAGINHGYAGYTHHFDKAQLTAQGGIQYLGYGKFKQTDATGQILGDFKASEYAIGFGVGRQYNEKLSYGANLKFVISNLESYNSFGFVTDFGVTYLDTAKLFSAALVIRNLGAQLSTYTPGNRESVAADLQFGLAKQLKHLPFRFSVVAHHLHQWNIRYDDPTIEEPTTLFGEDPQNGEKKFGIFMDNLFRHFILGGELLAGKNETFRLRFAYNHLRRAELNVNGTRSLAGFSTGLGLKIKQFRVDYGLSVYHLAGSAHQISIATQLSEFKK